MANRRGFTLIELLVVIAIIAILAAILFPVFATAREKARSATCESNEKQICLSLLQYSQDYDEVFPICWSEEYRSNSAINRSWDLLLAPYNGFVARFTSGSPVILACPDDASPRTSNYTPRTYALAGATDGYFNDSANNPAVVTNEAAQGFAGAVNVGYGGWLYQAGHQQSDIPAPGTTLMLVEVPGNSQNGGGHPGDNGDAVCFRPTGFHGIYTASCDTVGGGCGQVAMIATLVPIHSNGFNYGFCDGHVKWYDPHQTVGTADMVNYNQYCDVYPKAACNLHGLWSLTPNN